MDFSRMNGFACKNQRTAVCCFSAFIYFIVCQWNALETSEESIVCYWNSSWFPCLRVCLARINTSGKHNSNEISHFVFFLLFFFINNLTDLKWTKKNTFCFHGWVDERGIPFLFTAENTWRLFFVLIALSRLIIWRSEGDLILYANRNLFSNDGIFVYVENVTLFTLRAAWLFYLIYNIYPGVLLWIKAYSRKTKPLYIEF